MEDSKNWSQPLYPDRLLVNYINDEDGEFYISTPAEEPEKLAELDETVVVAVYKFAGFATIKADVSIEVTMTPEPN
jgi:hypothetical protein